MALYDEVMERLMAKKVPTAFVDTFNELGGQGTYSGIPSGTVLADSFQFPYEAGGKQAVTGGFDWSGPGDTNEQYTLPPIEASEWAYDTAWPKNPEMRLPLPGPVGRETETQLSDPVGYRGYGLGRAGGQMGMDVAADPLAYAGGASVVPPPNYQTSYNPAGGWAEAGRLAPDNIAAAETAGWNEVAQPFGGRGAGDRLGGASVVAPPRMPTERETLDREVMGPADDRDAAFSTIHGAWAGGADFGVETEWSEGLGVPEEYVGIYMAVPDQAKRYAHENPTDAILQQFEEKYGFPLDISVDIP